MQWRFRTRDYVFQLRRVTGFRKEDDDAVQFRFAPFMGVGVSNSFSHFSLDFARAVRKLLLNSINAAAQHAAKSLSFHLINQLTSLLDHRLYCCMGTDDCFRLRCCRSETGSRNWFEARIRSRSTISPIRRMSLLGPFVLLLWYL